MATYYVDYVDGLDSNDGLSSSTPVKTWNCSAIYGGSFDPGDTVSFKGGVTYPLSSTGRFNAAFSSSPTANNRFTINSYGTGRAIFDGGGTRDIGVRFAAAMDQANPPTYTTIDNIEFTGFANNAINYGEVANTGASTNYAVITNCYIHDCMSATEPAIKAWGTYVTVSDSLIEDCGNDGVWIKGYYATVTGNTIRTIGLSGTEGDCIQLEEGSYSTVTNNTCTKETYTKQAILVNMSVGYSLVSGNTISGLSQGGGILTIQGGLGTIVMSNIITSTDGIYILDSTGSNYIYGNKLLCTDPYAHPLIVSLDGDSTGIDFNGTNMHYIVNNTVSGYYRGIFSRYAYLANNIVVDCITEGFDTAAGALPTTEKYNYAYNNGTNFEFTKDVTSSEADPLFISTTDLRLQPGSPCHRAGIAINSYQTFYGADGRAFRKGNPSIGAYEQEFKDTLNFAV